MNEPLRVTYDVKDILGEIKRSLEQLNQKLDAKADTAIVTALDSRVDALAERFNLSEQRRKDREGRAVATFTRREKLLAAALGVMTLSLNLLVTLTGGRLH